MAHRLDTGGRLIDRAKPPERRGQVLIVNGEKDFVPGKNQNNLSDENVARLGPAFPVRCLNHGRRDFFSDPKDFDVSAKSPSISVHLGQA